MKQDYWNVSDEQVIEKTGKPLAEWITILDAFKAGEKKSNDVVAYLQQEYKCAALLGKNTHHSLPEKITDMKTAKPETVDAYIAGFPEETQAILEQMRETIKTAAPDAEESISYAMPGYKLFGFPLVYFAGYKGHIGFYATPTGHEAFERELSVYKQGKGSVQFPIDEPMPLKLITKIVKFRVKENAERAKTKKK